MTAVVQEVDGRVGSSGFGIDVVCCMMQKSTCRRESDLASEGIGIRRGKAWRLDLPNANAVTG